MQYEQALEIIKAKQSLGIKPGLSAVEALLKKMGSPQEKLRVSPSPTRQASSPSPKSTASQPRACRRCSTQRLA